MNKADEAKLCSPIHLTFEALVVPCAVERCHGENWALLVDQCLLQVLQFLVHLINLLLLSDVIVLLRFRSCSGSDQQKTTKQ